MRIGIAGTGTLAEALGAGWVRAGHQVVVAGRGADKAAALAARLGERARVVPLSEVGRDTEAVLLAVPWQAVEDVLRVAGDSLAGTVVIDPTNPVRHAEGVVLLEPGRSAAQEIADRLPEARVVKAFTLFPAAQWHPDSAGPVTVAICGDAEALEVVSVLVRGVGGLPAQFGPLSRARQLEETAGFVIRLAFSGFDPRSAVPQVPQRRVGESGSGDGPAA